LYLRGAFVQFERRADNVGIFNPADLHLQLGRVGSGLRRRILNLALDISAEGLRIVEMSGPGLVIGSLVQRRSYAGSYVGVVPGEALAIDFVGGV
jgi:hypothetical protein